MILKPTLKQVRMKKIDHLDFDKIHQFSEYINFEIQNIINTANLHMTIHEVLNIHIIINRIKREINLDIEKNISTFVKK